MEVPQQRRFSMMGPSRLAQDKNLHDLGREEKTTIEACKEQTEAVVTKMSTFLQKNFKSQRNLMSPSPSGPGRFPSNASALPPKQKMLLVMSDEEQWPIFKEGMKKSKGVTNYAMQNIILDELLDESIDQMENRRRQREVKVVKLSFRTSFVARGA